MKKQLTNKAVGFFLTVAAIWLMSMTVPTFGQSLHGPAKGPSVTPTVIHPENVVHAGSIGAVHRIIEPDPSRGKPPQGTVPSGKTALPEEYQAPVVPKGRRYETVQDVLTSKFAGMSQQDVNGSYYTPPDPVMA